MPPETSPALERQPWWQAITAWARRVRLSRHLAVLLTLAAVLAGLATWAALSETPPFGKDPNTVLLLLTLDLVILLLLGALIARRVATLFARRRQGQAGSRLHLRVVGVFSLLAVAPAILVAIFAAVFFHLGIQSWFSERVHTAVTESLAVAEAYLQEHQQVIRADALAMANDLNRQAPALLDSPLRFHQVVGTQAALRSLTEAVVFAGDGQILARSGLSFSLEFEPIADSVMQAARAGDVVLMVGEGDDRVRALVRLDNFVDGFLLVGRLVEPKVLAHMETAAGAVREYTQLQGRAGDFQIMVTLIFVVVALLLLMAAVWFGMNFANRLADPMARLMQAADRIRAGDLSARVPEQAEAPDDDLGLLARSFNRMTGQLQAQRQELLRANHQLDARRRFTEAVLAGVSAGVLGLSREGTITLANRSALELLAVDNSATLAGRALLEIVPELQELFTPLLRGHQREAAGQVAIDREPEGARTLLVRISADDPEGPAGGFVLTFDDISALTAAQRKAAWADVARRIAHEIKNPLTPIQLSAERLRRKYLQEITSDPATFDSCVATIIRQVDEIGRMVDEFSAFARMPAPSMAVHDVVQLVRPLLQQQQATYPHLLLQADWPAAPLLQWCDAALLTRALLNVIKNAAEAIEGREGGDLSPGHIHITLQADSAVLTIAVADNGRGLPEQERHRLTEPYITTRAKGTGLGLAIVSKIMEDHGGMVRLSDQPGGGAIVTLELPRRLSAEEPAPLDHNRESGNAA